MRIVVSLLSGISTACGGWPLVNELDPFCEGFIFDENSGGQPLVTDGFALPWVLDIFESKPDVSFVSKCAKATMCQGVSNVIKEA